MIGLVTLYESGRWVASGAFGEGRQYDVQAVRSYAKAVRSYAKAVRSYAEAALLAGGGALMVASFEIHKGDFTCHEVVDLTALRCLQKLVTFLEDV